MTSEEESKSAELEPDESAAELEAHETEEKEEEEFPPQVEKTRRLDNTAWTTIVKKIKSRSTTKPGAGKILWTALQNSTSWKKNPVSIVTLLY